MVEDKILIWRFRRGSREALEQIYCKYEALLLTVAAAILGDLAGAEDVVHDVFVTFAQSPDKVRPDGSLQALPGRVRDQPCTRQGPGPKEWDAGGRRRIPCAQGATARGPGRSTGGGPLGLVGPGPTARESSGRSWSCT